MCVQQRLLWIIHGTVTLLTNPKYRRKLASFIFSGALGPTARCESMTLTVFDNNSISRIPHMRRTVCVPTVDLQCYFRLTYILGQLVQRRFRWSGHAAGRTSFCPHNLVHGESDLDVSWRHGHRHSGKTWNLPLDHESSVVHDEERTGWTFQVS